MGAAKRKALKQTWERHGQERSEVDAAPAAETSDGQDSLGALITAACAVVRGKTEKVMRWTFDKKQYRGLDPVDCDFCLTCTVRWQKQEIREHTDVILVTDNTGTEPVRMLPDRSACAAKLPLQEDLIVPYPHKISLDRTVRELLPNDQRDIPGVSSEQSKHAPLRGKHTSLFADDVTLELLRKRRAELFASL
jgi:hypothetical protein